MVRPSGTCRPESSASLSLRAERQSMALIVNLPGARQSPAAQAASRLRDARPKDRCKYFSLSKPKPVRSRSLNRERKSTRADDPTGMTKADGAKQFHGCVVCSKVVGAIGPSHEFREHTIRCAILKICSCLRRHIFCVVIRLIIPAGQMQESMDKAKRGFFVGSVAEASRIPATTPAPIRISPYGKVMTSVGVGSLKKVSVHLAIARLLRMVASISSSSTKGAPVDRIVRRQAGNAHSAIDRDKGQIEADLSLPISDYDQTCHRLDQAAA